MNTDEYLKEIGISGDSADRVMQIIRYYKDVLDLGDYEELFICDYFAEDGNRNYSSLWLFYKDSICEAKDFLKTNDFDFAKFDKSIHYWNLETKELDFDGFNENSRIKLEVSIGNNTRCEFKAAKNNCRYLIDLLRKWKEK